MKKIILFAFVLLFTIQCKNETIKDNEGKELFPMEQTKLIESIDDYIQEIEYINPDTSWFLYPGKMLLGKNGDFITSSKNGDIISMDSIGRFKRIIARRGKGNREYINQVDLALSKNEDHLLILDATKIKVYGINDSTYYNEINLPARAVVDAIAPSDDNNIFLYSAYSSRSNDNDEYLVLKINEKGDVIEQLLKRDDHTFTIDNITQSYGNVYYLRPQNANHVFYKFSKDLIPAYKINFGNKNIPYQYNNYNPKTNDNDMGMFMKSPYYKLPISLYETKDILWFSAAGPDNAEKNNFIYFKNKTAGINWRESNKEPLIPLISSDENYIYFMYNGINTSSYNKDNTNENSPLFRYISNIFINKWNLTIDDDVIVKIKFKEKK